MLESLRYRLDRDDLTKVVLVLLFCAAIGFLELWRVSSSKGPLSAVVISAGAMSVAKICGGTKQVASVQLANGLVVYASVDLPRPLLPGTRVSVEKQWLACSGVYDVVAVQ